MAAAVRPSACAVVPGEKPHAPVPCTLRTAARPDEKRVSEGASARGGARKLVAGRERVRSGERRAPAHICEASCSWSPEIIGGVRAPCSDDGIITVSRAQRLSCSCGHIRASHVRCKLCVRVRTCVCVCVCVCDPASLPVAENVAWSCSRLESSGLGTSVSPWPARTVPPGS